MNPRLRRDACPTIAVPMETGDGRLARLPPSAPLSAESLLAVCDAAGRFGNGVIEITARGSIQVRGLSGATAASFAGALAAAGIGDARPAILAGPLAGLDPEEAADMRGFVRALRDAIAADGVGAALAPKVSVVIDGGGALHLDAVDADLRFVARGEAVFAVALGGTAASARPVGLVAMEDSAPAVLTVLRMIAARGPAARGRDLDPDGVAAAIGARFAGPEPAHRAPAEPVGFHRLRDGNLAVGVGLPFGQTSAAILAPLVEAARDCGAEAFAPAERRTLLALGVAPGRAAMFRDRAAGLGFIVDAGDPRRAVIACAGAPACSSGLMPGRAIAADVAAAAAPVLDGSVAIHISGCAKGCASPRSSTLTFAGGGRGAGLVVSGRASDVPAVIIPSGELRAAAARIAKAVVAARRPGETAAAAMARLGAGRIASAAARETVDA